MILVTGAAGFIGYHFITKLLASGFDVLGIDSISNYYDVRLKHDRLALLKKNERFIFHNIDLCDVTELQNLFHTHKEIEYVIHLAAQPGVRYSLENPYSYVKNNVEAFVALFEIVCKMPNIKHVMYASSSSVYGNSSEIIMKEEFINPYPSSLYAVTKVSNEYLANYYSFYYKIPMTGLRFFTVFGPYGRPDMMPYIFLEALYAQKPLTLFTGSQMYRDFTFVDDTVDIMYKLMMKLPETNSLGIPATIYNIAAGNKHSVDTFLNYLEVYSGIKALKHYQSPIICDVVSTQADTAKLFNAIGTTHNFYPLEEGIKKFISWYKEYKNV